MVENAKWSLTIGIHRGTITSRDTEHPKQMDSLEACQKEVNRAELEYARFGCYIWFARAVDPEGKTYRLHPGTPYLS